MSIVAHLTAGESAVIASGLLWQWDRGQTLEFAGVELPPAFKADFCNAGDSETKPMTGTDGAVVIPDEFLLDGRPAICFVVVPDLENERETKYKIIMPVIPRPQPSDIEPTPEQEAEIDQLIAALNAALEALDKALPKGIVTPEMYDAVGDGVADDTAAMQAALESGNIVLAEKTYLLGEVNAPDGAVLVCTPETTIIKAKNSSDNHSGIFQCQGTTLASGLTLAADAPEKAQTITLTDASSISVGDHIVLRNNGARPDSYKVLTTVVSAISGNAITLAHPLNWSYSAATATAMTFRPARFIALGNGATVNGNADVLGAGRRHAFWLKWNAGSLISGFSVVNSATGLARIDQSVGCTFRDCSGERPLMTDTVPYREFLNIATSTGITVENTRTVDYRRSVDWIAAYLCTASGCSATRGGFTAHGELSTDCSFVDCVSVLPDTLTTLTNTIGNEGGDNYFDRRIAFVGCRIIGGNAPIKIMQDSSAIIRDCYIESVNGSGNGAAIYMASSGSSAEIYDTEIRMKGRCIRCDGGTEASPSVVRARGCYLYAISSVNGSGNVAVAGAANNPIYLDDCTVSGTAPAVGANVKAAGCRFENEVEGAEAQGTALTGCSFTDCAFSLGIEAASSATDIAFVRCTAPFIVWTPALPDAATDINGRIVDNITEFPIDTLSVERHNILVKGNIVADFSRDPLYAAFVTESASGTDETSPASISDGADDIPIKALSVDLTATQEGTGAASPENVRPITGVSALTVSQSGDDMSEVVRTATYNFAASTSGTVYGGTLDVLTGLLTVTYILLTITSDTVATYSASASGGTARVNISLRDQFRGSPSLIKSNIYASIGTSNTGWDKLYVAPGGRTIIIRDSRYTSEAIARELLDETPVQVLLPLENQREYQFPLIEIKTLLGGNNFWSTAGEISLTYRADPYLYIQNHGGGGGGTSDYDQLSNRPSINGVTLTGNKTAAQLGLGTYSKPSGGIPASDLAAGVIPTVPTKVSDLTNDSGFVNAAGAAAAAPVQSVNGQTGAVSLPIPSSAADVGAIAAPSSPATGDFLCWNGSAWAATTLAAWQAGSY